LFLTRLVQRWLREGVYTQTRMDAGISNSIDQAVGYSGIALAALLAVSYAGFDITNLAIVAGALSVGIGFGLQSIVNNFVSGLILLVERPIKVGDWIALGDQQGNVRRISVRSTEIETFDRASLIVPNSELISGRVLNWTHRNLLGRVVIKFPLEGGADPEKVLKIMLECARSHPQVQKSPEPIASLDSFSPGLLEFSLRATVNDVNRGLMVLTDLRIGILKELRRQGQIPITNTPSGAAPLPVAAQ
jgi:potassium-dependent mechanosensitive channel